MDYTELLPPLPEPDDELKHVVGLACLAGAESAAGPIKRYAIAYALAAIAAAAPAIRRAERQRCAAVCRGGHDAGIIDAGSAAWCSETIRTLPEEP